MGMEIDDDVYFADLSKQIALLIMDDDDEEFPAQRPSSLPVQSFTYAPQAVMLPQFAYDMSCRRESKGTGVFIPRSSFPRKKNRSGRSSSINNNSQRQEDKLGVATPHIAIANRTCSNGNYRGSGVPKRHS